MKNKFLVICAIAVIITLSGCSISHPVAKDYPQYISKNNKGSLPTTNLESKYLIDSETSNHRYEFRAATVGYAHLWIVEFGKILDETLNASYVQSSFGSLERSYDGVESIGNIIQFTLNSYEFKNYRAYVSMNVTLTNNGKEVLSKNYMTEGDAKGGQMFGLGPFGMTNATLDSTRTAIDKILTQFIYDLPRT